MRLPRFVLIALLVLAAGGIGYLVGIFKPVYDFKTRMITVGAVDQGHRSRHRPLAEKVQAATVCRLRPMYGYRT